MTRLLDFNPLTGESVTFRYDHATDQFIIGHHQDTTAVVEDNQAAMLDIDAHRRQAKNDWAHYAKIHNVVIMKWKQDHGVDFFDRNHWSKVMSLLNSPDYRYLKRTSYFHDR